MLVLLAQVARLSSIPASTSGGVGTVAVAVAVAAASPRPSSDGDRLVAMAA